MLNNITSFLDTHPIGKIFKLGKKKAVWKKVNELYTGMKIAIENSGNLDWDEIVSVKKVGRERVWDIEVEGTHNFVGNGIIAHNTKLDGLSLTDTGDLTISESQNTQTTQNIGESDSQNLFQLSNAAGEIINRIGTFGKLVAAHVKTGLIETKELVVEGSVNVAGNIKAGTAEVTELTVTKLQSAQATVDKLIAQNTQTALISPIPGGTDITVRLGTRDEALGTSQEGKLTIQNAQGEEVSSLDSQGNATFSGTLYADDIKSQSLDDINALLNQVKTDQDLLNESRSWNVNSATDSANFKELVVSDLYVTGQTAVDSLSISKTITVGSELIVQSSGIDTLTAPLRIQSLALAPVEIMAGLIKIDTSGNVQIAGNLFVAGTVKANNYQLTTNDVNGNPLAEINASGSAKFNDLTAGGLVIAGPDATVSGTIINGVITTSSTIGKAVILAETSEITIKNPKVTDYTMVYVTPTSSTQNNVLYVKSKQNGQFVVGFTTPLDIDVNFNWWIVQVQ